MLLNGKDIRIMIRNCVYNNSTCSRLVPNYLQVLVLSCNRFRLLKMVSFQSFDYVESIIFVVQFRKGLKRRVLMLDRLTEFKRFIFNPIYALRILQKNKCSGV